MIPELRKENIFLEDGQIISIETGKLACQANGTAVVRMGKTSLIATIVISKKEKEGINFLPLIIDYKENYSAGGKIPGGFIKRERRPSDEEVLTMRLIDRLLRPLFPQNFLKEIQIIIYLLSYDRNVLPDGLAGLVASAAVSISGIPFKGPVSAVRIIRFKNSFLINPGIKSVKKSDINLIIGGTKNSILMIEGEMKEISENEIIYFIKIAHFFIKLQITAQINLIKNLKIKRNNLPVFNNLNFIYLKNKIKYIFYEKIYCLYKQASSIIRFQQMEILLLKINNYFLYDNIILNEDEQNYIFEILKKEILREIILKENHRLDGRSLDDLRKIWSQTNFLPSVHGSAIFSRGETQALSTVTLGSSLDVNKIDNVILQDQQKFYLHYNFPPFSTGEIKLLKGISRREIGHGNLAQRALKNIIPFKTPYTIRVVSDILESNGSSSMATVCASTLALMDAGIPIKRPVSGISMGLIINFLTDEAIILSDILGDEDNIGDMDFKMTGTKFGITACQMDINFPGSNYEMLLNSIFKAKNCLLFLIKKILNTIQYPRFSFKENSPKIFYFEIKKKLIGTVIGSGGKIIQEIKTSTNTNLKIEEEENLGIIEIYGKTDKQIKNAILKIKNLIFFPKKEKLYKVKIKSIKNSELIIILPSGQTMDLKKSENLNLYSFLRKGDWIKIKSVNQNGKINFKRII
ncbi:putative polyribonucleotide nucleotidyltransferase [Candidatus Sulcia muelleri SMDSEM]|uniref:Polyribonucleotide nucleotidyltransferase n=1 Tax=Karelsulcia muelleri (strain SMDSEM) TaxID=595499 RepID=C7LKG2_KARMS|nr:putative polyribonucleotide nucleotidyltransferase [Candidatus Karelsulcia muelleri SMDSEM]